MNQGQPSAAGAIGQESAVAAAAAALRAGQLVVFPTETVYGVAANAQAPQAVGQLLKLTGAAPGDPSTWHAPDSQTVLDALGIKVPLHRRLFKRLAPGPVRFIVEMVEAELAQRLNGLGVSPGVMDRAGEVCVRISNHPIARAVIERAGVPVIAGRASAMGLGDGRSLPDNASERAAGMGIRSVLDDGPTRLGVPSTAVRLKLNGSYEIGSTGVYDARAISRMVERRVLFVCTGNTCRSPMAEAIARDLIAQGATSIPTHVVSAGVMASNGAPMTPQARAALEEMGVSPGAHRSRDLDQRMLADAEVVYGLTTGHVQSIIEVAPRFAGKVFLLDPSGTDVPDPIGGPLEEYRVTAKRLRALIEGRLKELEG